MAKYDLDERPGETNTNPTGPLGPANPLDQVNNYQDKQWLKKVANDPEFQRLYVAYKNGERMPDGTAGSYAFNQYLNKIGLPKGKSFTMVNGEPALKDRVSGWTIPLMAAAAAGTLGFAAFAMPAIIGASGAAGGSAAGAAAIPSVAGAIPVGSVSGAALGAGAGLTGAQIAGMAAPAVIGAAAPPAVAAALPAAIAPSVAPSVGATIPTATTTAGGGGALSTIGNIAKKGYDAYNQYQPYISAASEVAGKMAEGRAQGRLQEYMAGLSGDEIALRRAGQAKEFEGTDQRRMLANDLLSRLQDVNINAPWLPHVSSSGGIRASALSPAARAAVAAAAGQYRNAMLGVGRPVVGSPGATPHPQSGAMDKLLSILGAAGSIAGAAGSVQRPTPVGGNPATLNTTYKPPAPRVNFALRND